MDAGGPEVDAYMARKQRQAGLRCVPRDRFGRAPELERLDLLYMVVKRLHASQGSGAIVDLLSPSVLADLNHVTQRARADGHVDCFFGFETMSAMLRAIAEVPASLEGQSVYAMVARSAYLAR